MQRRCGRKEARLSRVLTPIPQSEENPIILYAIIATVAFAAIGATAFMLKKDDKIEH